MNWAPYWEQNRVMSYGNGETSSAHVLLIPSAGDPGVPVASGIALARAAGFVPYGTVDPRYGKSVNQKLIEVWAVEGVSRVARYTDSSGNGVLMDVEDLSAITGANDGFGVPRLVPPMRLTAARPGGGVSGVLIPMLKPKGLHGFVNPDPSASFDLGGLLFNMLGRYLSSNGTAFGYEACQVTSTCPWIAPVPP
jgi:hypothetical protein